jgi:hypothetical protein
MQSRRAGIAVAVLGVAVAVVLFIVLSGGDDDDSSSEATTAAVTTTTTTDGGGGGGETTTKTTTPTKPEFPTIEIENGEPVGGVQDLSFDAGEDIRFRVESDADWEIHFHGYELSENVKAGGEVEFDVPATAEGVFEVEIEETATHIAEITVNP